MRLTVGDDEELALLIRVTALSDSRDISSDERTVIRAVRWWFLTGNRAADPFELAAPFPDRQSEIADRIVSRTRERLRAIVDGPDLGAAQVARRVLRRNWGALERSFPERDSQS
jgi:hypothetical protein